MCFKGEKQIQRDLASRRIAESKILTVDEKLQLVFALWDDNATNPYKSLLHD